MTVASLLLLADARFPDGSHAHSYGIEAAVAHDRVHDAATLGSYIEARLWTVGRTDAAAARLAATGDDLIPALDAALEVRTPSAAARATSRSLGRSLARTTARLWPDRPLPTVGGRAPLQPVALGAAAARADCTPEEAALCSAHGMAAALASAALRLRGLDPFTVTAVLEGLRTTLTSVVESVSSIDSVHELPCASTPFGEIDPELQQTLNTRLFGS